MVAIAPFRALRYGPDVDLPASTSPPHDCIPAGQKPDFLRCPTSIVRIILGEPRPGDHDYPDHPNWFDRAAQDLKAWQADGTLLRDEKPAYYLYEATHRPGPDAGGDGAPVTMRALVARLRVDPAYNEVRRHEKTLHRKKRDRLTLREATLCDVEPIWLLYRDERGWVEELLRSNAFTQLCRFTDEAGIEHCLWRVDRREAVEELTAQFDDRTVVIADGHHRYQTAIDHAAATHRPQDASILVCLVRDNDPGILIEATHRLAHGLRADATTWIAQADAHWDVTPEPAPRPDDAEGWNRILTKLGPTRLAMVTANPLQLHFLRLRDASGLDGARGRLDTLAVTLCQERLLAECWGAASAEDHLSFTRDVLEAVHAVVAGKEQVAILLPPEQVSAVLEVAQQGHLMPQKSTYFIPKLRSGLVLSPLDEPLPVPWQQRVEGPGKADFRRPHLP